MASKRLQNDVGSGAGKTDNSDENIVFLQSDSGSVLGPPGGRGIWGFNDCYNRLKEMTVSEEKIENENRFKKTVLIVYNRCKRMVEKIMEDDGSHSSVAISTGSYTPERGQALGWIQSLRAFRRANP